MQWRRATRNGDHSPSLITLLVIIVNNLQWRRATRNGYQWKYRDISNDLLKFYRGFILDCINSFPYPEAMMKAFSAKEQ